MRKKATRRNFIRLSTFGLGGLAITKLAANKPGVNFLAVPNASEKQLKIVCAGAHPGDPEFGCGGTMAKYSAAGHKITFLYLTRGEAYDANKTHDAAAALRTKEAETACAALNVTPRFAGQIDGDTILSPPQNEAIFKIIAAEKPDMVFTQWPMDTHPDHQVTGLLLLNAWTKMNKSIDLYFYEVNTGSETMSFVPTDYVDITGFRNKKKAAMWAHQTQEPEKTYNSFFKQMEEFRGLEANVVAAEAFIRYKPKEN
jgi:LmbE family N-acetylglucosaminyl deacetylase